MNKIKIFLASSNELIEDRKEFEIRINRKNKIISDSGYFVHLENWEDLSTKMSKTRSQDEYNEKIRSCNIFVLLGYSKIGMYTEEEFDVALEHFKNVSTPQIHTYFKEIKTKTDPSIDKFKAKLNDLKHFYASYTNIESLWNQLNSEIDLFISNIGSTSASVKEIDYNKVLFNNYSKDVEPYYLERTIDYTFNDSLRMENVWIFGKSGSGKTTLINRNLKNNDIEYCYCDLSPTNINSTEDVLNDILCTIEDKFNINREDNEKNIIKNIANILSRISSKEIVIVIDELAVEDNTLLQKISESLINLVVFYSNNNSNELKFVVSTISTPKTIIKNISKAGNYFQFLCCDDWKNDNILLLEIISNALKINLDSSKDLILSKSQNSPRILKSIIKKIIIGKKLDNNSVKVAVEKVISEIV
jgi:nucleoside-triphosphatase THEP1